MGEREKERKKRSTESTPEIVSQGKTKEKKTYIQNKSCFENDSMPIRRRKKERKRKKAMMSEATLLPDTRCRREEINILQVGKFPRMVCCW